MAEGLSNYIQSAAALVDPSAPSVPKWWPVRDLLAEAIGLEPEEVYVSTISKPSNLKKCSEQSQWGTGARVMVAMFTAGPDQLEYLLRSARARCLERNLMILIFTDEGAGFMLVAVVKPTAAKMPSKLATAYPAASLVNC